MRVVTISREFGSVGDSFGLQVARELGYHFVDKAFVSTLLAEYGMVGFDRDYESRPGFWQSRAGEHAQRRSAMADMLNKVVLALAHHGDVVIQGRSGFAILADFADVLHVRLRAPASARVENIRSSLALSPEEAAAMVVEGDGVRTSFVEDFYGVPWDSTQAFDLVINTAKVPSGDAQAVVVAAARRLEATAGPGEFSTASITVDLVLEKAVLNHLGCSLLHP